MVLRKHDFAALPVARSPDLDSPLQSPKLAFLVSLGMLPTQILKDRLRFNCFVPFQKLCDLWPYLLERILPRSPSPLPSCLARKFLQVPVLPRCLLIHSRFRCCCRQRLLFLDQLHESPVLPICNRSEERRVGKECRSGRS